MLTGRAPFRGRTVSESLTRCSTEPGLEALPKATPIATRRLLRLCLERSPRPRLQHIGDARVDIADTRSRRRRTPGARRSTASSYRRRLQLVTVGLGYSRSRSWQVGLRGRVQFPRPRSSRALQLIPTGRQSQRPRRSIAISPDGSRLAYVAGGWLWLPSWQRQKPCRCRGRRELRNHSFRPTASGWGFST